MINWDDYPNFSENEFKCSCGCGKADMQPEFMAKLQELRDQLGSPMTINSGFRCENHPEEAGKPTPGAHGQGMAADVAAMGGDKDYELKRLAYEMGFQGIGHARSFTHLDIGHAHAHRPADWRYS